MSEKQETSTEMTVASNFHSISEAKINGEVVAYCSYQADNEEARLSLYNAIQDVDVSVKDMINKPIRLQNVYIEPHQFTDDEGNLQDEAGIRIILIDDNMKGYACAASGVYNSLLMMESICGPFPWAEPRTVVPVSKTAKRGNVLKLVFANE